jgi:hypothetical protein
MEPKNRCQGINSASLCSLADLYDNPIPTRCLAPIDFLKIPALISHWPTGIDSHSLVGYWGKKPLWSSAMLYKKISMIEQQNCTHIYTKLNITTYIHVHISLHFYLYCLLLDSNPVFLRHY